MGVAVMVPKVATHGHFLVGSSSGELLSYHKIYAWLVTMVVTVIVIVVLDARLVILIKDVAFSNGIVVTMVVTVTPIVVTGLVIFLIHNRFR